MDDVRAMNRLQRAEDLIDEVLAVQGSDESSNGGKTLLHTHLTMIISQLLCPDNPVQICLHKFLNDCNRGGGA